MSITKVSCHKSIKNFSTDWDRTIMSRILQRQIIQIEGFIFIFRIKYFIIFAFKYVK